MSPEAEYIAALGEWLHEQLPSYACAWADANGIEWAKIITPQYIPMYSTGECAAIVLACHAYDWSSILGNARSRGLQMADATFMQCLARVSPQAGSELMVLLLHRLRELV